MDLLSSVLHLSLYNNFRNFCFDTKKGVRYSLIIFTEKLNQDCKQSYNRIVIHFIGIVITIEG